MDEIPIFNELNELNIVKFEKLLILYMVGNIDINYVDSNGRTIVSKLIEKGVNNKIVYYKIFQIGYNVLNFNVLDNNQLISYFSSSLRFNYLDQFLLGFENTEEQIEPYTRGGNSKIFLKFVGTKVNVIKRSDILYDIQKEFFISKKVSSKFAKTVIKIEDFYGKHSIIMEYGFFSLDFFLKTIKDVRIVTTVFKNLLIALRNFNSLGFIHFDLKPDNILVFPDLSVRLIDFGMSVYMGLSNSYKSFVSTHIIKSPDDYNDYHIFTIDKVNVNLFCQDTIINYSVDMYAFSVIFFSFFLDLGRNFHFLNYNDKIYIYERVHCENSYMTRVSRIRSLTNEEIMRMNVFFPNFNIVVENYFNLNANLRYTSFSFHEILNVQENHFITSFYENYKLIQIPGKTNNCTFSCEDLNYCLNTRLLMSTNAVSSNFISCIPENSLIEELFLENISCDLKDFFPESYICYIKNMKKFNHDYIFFDDLIKLFCLVKGLDEEKEKDLHKKLLEKIPSNESFFLFSFFQDCC